MAEFDVVIDGKDFIVEAEDMDTAIAAIKKWRADQQSTMYQPPDPSQPMGAGGGAGAAANWIAENPQGALDLLLQSLGTAGGIGLSTFTGAAAPVTAPALGALGNVGGKQASRAIGQTLGFPDASPAPDIASVETAVDAGLGAFGPAASHVARPLARAFTGATPKVVGEQAGRFASRNSAVEASETLSGAARDRWLAAAASQPGQRAASVEAAEALDLVAGTAKGYADKMSVEIPRAAAQTAERVARRRGGAVGQLTNIGSLVHAVSTGDLVTAAAIFGGGHAVNAAQRRAIERLIQNEKFVGWLNKAAPTTNSQLTGSLSTILAKETLTPAERADIQTVQGLQGNRQGTREREAERATYDPSVDRHRAPSGQFTTGPRHGEDPWGNMPDDTDGDDDEGN